MKSNYYTFIAYKSNSSDYCRGCHMASYGSDFIYFSSTKVEEIINKLSEVYFANCNTKINESGYEEIVILKNGIDMDNLNLSDEDWALDVVVSVGDRLIQERQEIESAAKLRVVVLSEGKAEKENQEKIAALKAKVEAEKASRHQQYMKLKNEFAPN